MNSYITVCHEEARQAAREADRQSPQDSTGAAARNSGAVKDQFDTAGIRTTYGRRWNGTTYPPKMRW